MAKIQVILTQDVAGKGRKGDMITVMQKTLFLTKTKELLLLLKNFKK